MKSKLNDKVINEVHLDKTSVWMLTERKTFDYSDGIVSERYIKKVFSQVQDLTSQSHELEQWIKDWPSEYHFSKKRSQLLRGFDFDRSKKVLEVGCGCGAITRFLGETFDDVVSIEGSLARAELARLRTKNMNNVQILCAPFQEIVFSEKFDIVFCIGVYEYSGSFVTADDPYETILEYFSSMLKPDGVLVFAIENQFGLKYFSSSKEDHTNIMFDGIEGYPHFGKKVRTFGYDELKDRLKKYFKAIDFYFPYPDYKVPECILSEFFFSKVNAGEIVGKYESRDYLNDQKPLFDAKLTCLELDKNKKLPFFSNSFLVLAGKQEIQSIKQQGLGVLFNTDRVKRFQTITRFREHADMSIWADKVPLGNNVKLASDVLTLHPTLNKWESGLSLQLLIVRKAREKDITLDDLFSPCRIWLKQVQSLCTANGDRDVLDGRYVDSIWRNSFIRGDVCTFIDQEWEWNEKISLNVLVIRCIYWFLKEICNTNDLHPALRVSSTMVLIKKIGRALNIQLNQIDFDEFYKLEYQISQTIYNSSRLHIWFSIKFFLINKSLFLLVRKIKNCLRKLRVWQERTINYLHRHAFK